MFEPSEGSRRKQAQRAGRLLEPGTQIHSIVLGSGNARLATGTIVAVGTFGAAFVVAALLGYVILPGGLLFWYVYTSTRPPRALAVTDRGIAVFARSFWTGKANKLLVRYPIETFVSGDPVASGDPRAAKVLLHFGGEQVRFSRKEFDRLAAAVYGLTGRAVTQPMVLPSA